MCLTVGIFDGTRTSDLVAALEGIGWTLRREVDDSLSGEELEGCWLSS